MRVANSCESFPLVGNELFDQSIVEQLQMLVRVAVCDVHQSRSPVYTHQMSTDTQSSYENIAVIMSLILLTL